MKSRAIFLDRDGTINVDYGYLYRPSDIEFIPDAIEAMKLLSARGYKLIIITNQSGIGRGYFSADQYVAFSEAFNSQLRSRGVEICDTYMCPHSPSNGCSCRKPYPAMVEQAIAEHSIDASGSYMFGDKPSDVECGEAAGVTSRLITESENLLYWATEIIENRI